MQTSTTPNETFPLGQTRHIFLGGNWVGIKASGMGREGPRYAIEEMSETKIIIITQTCRRKPRPFMAGRNAAFLILGFGGGAFKRLFVHLFSFLDMPLNIWYKRKYENGDNGKAQTVSHARTVRGIASNATGLS